MVTMNELIYSIWSTVRPNQSITDPITEELIKFHIKNARATLLRQDLNKNRSVDPYIIQDLGCIDLVEADAAECCDIAVDCKVLRTAVPIPSMIELNQKTLITRVGPVIKSAKKWDIIPYERVPFEGLNKFTKNLIKVYQISNSSYIYILIPSNCTDSDAEFLEKINVQGVLEDPDEAKSFTQCGGGTCYTDDDKYPIKQWMVDPIKKAVIALLATEVKYGTDNSSNQKPDFEQPIVNN